MSYREYAEAISREVEKHPGVAVEFSSRSKHKQAILTFEGRSRFVMLPSSPGKSHRGINNQLRDVRRELRNLGAIH